MPTLTPLGRLVRLQVQRSSLKTGEKPTRRYDPAPLLPVKELTLTPEGAVAHAPNGDSIYDVHHALHPDTRNDHNLNALSVNFVGHYDLMRAEYGGHLWNGSAGENILIDCPRRIKVEQLNGGLAIQRPGAALVWLRSIVVAHPCLPFSGYVLGGDESLVKTALQFLDNGMRGFYGALDSTAPAIIAIGDVVLLATL